MDPSICIYFRNMNSISIILKRNYSLLIFIVIATVAGAQQSMTPASMEHGFIPDLGQLHDQTGKRVSGIHYLRPGGKGLNVQIKDAALSYDTYSRDRGTGAYSIRRLDLRFLEAQTESAFKAEEPLEGQLNFYNQVCPRGITEVPHFGRLVQQNIYPGIDLVHAITAAGDYKYDLVVHEGADAASIRMEYTGHGSVEVKDNALIFQFEDRTLTETLPASWFAPGNRPVEMRFIEIENTPGRLVVGIVPAGDLIHSAGSSLVIDPMPFMAWATYIGGEGVDAGTAIATDTIGLVHVAGYTNALVSMVSTGAHQVEYGGGETDAFLMRFASWGSPLWCTYYGGSGNDRATGVSVDYNYDIYLVGHTDSPDSMATDSSHQSMISGGGDAFIVKFDSLGSRIWASYLGGLEDDIATSCIPDRDGRVYVAGTSSSAELFANAQAQPVLPHGGGTDAFVALFDTDGMIVHCTFKGGAGDETGAAIARDHDGSILLAGSTSSAEAIASDGAYQELLTGSMDGFITLFNDTLTDQLWSTYYGGEGEDAITGVVFGDSTIYFTGHTTSQEPITDTTAYQQLPGGGIDAFVAQFTLEGERSWSTYFGGEEDDMAFGISVDWDGEVYIIGTTSSPGMATDEAFQQQLQGGTDIFVARFDTINNLDWSTYYGGTDSDHGAALCVYGVTVVFITGSTSSETVPMWEGLQQQYGGGDTDALLVRFVQIRSTPPIDIECTGGGGGGGGGWTGGTGGTGGGVYCGIPGNGIAICLGESVTLSLVGGALGWGSYWMWYQEDCGDPSSFLLMGPELTISPTSNVTIYVRAENAFSYSACVAFRIWVDQPVTAEGTGPASVCMGDTINLSATGGVCYHWTGPQDFESFEAITAAPTDSLSGTVQYVVTSFGQYGACTATDTVEVLIDSVPAVEWTVTAPMCLNGEDGSMEADSISSAALLFHWPALASDASSLNSLAAGEYVVVLTNALGCSRTDTVIIAVPEILVDSLVATNAICGDANGTMTVIVQGDPDEFTFEWDNGGQDDPVLGDLVAGTYLVTVTDPLGCIHELQGTVVDTGLFTVTIEADTSVIFQGGEVLLTAILDPLDEGSSYLWSPAGSVDDSTSNAVIAAPDSTMLFTVTVTSSLGCSATETITITVLIDDGDGDGDGGDAAFDPPCPELFIPTMFSPNEDGRNDGFGVLGGCLQEMHLVVYDRSGNMVFESRTREQTWDGRHRGEVMSNGALPFTFTAIDEEGGAITQTGIVNIVR